MDIAAQVHIPDHIKCPCTRSEIRRRTLSSGVVIFALQCLSCGRQIRAVKKDSPEVRALTDARPFDETLQTAWDERVSAFYANRRLVQQAQRDQEKAEWREWYAGYLKSVEWRVKRQQVLTRANNWCEGCAAQPATQVHHLTYDHVGNELLFELVAVCDECHERIHPHMGSR